MVIGVRDVITCIKFGGDRLRGLGLEVCQISPFHIDFVGRPYNSAMLLSCVVEIPKNIYHFIGHFSGTPWLAG